MKNKNIDLAAAVKRGLTHEASIDTHVGHIREEFKQGFEFIKDFPKSVSIFGSARAKQGSTHYESAKKLGNQIAGKLGYAVVTGGGPGIMEAANKGAIEAGGISVGLNISLPHEQGGNQYTNHAMKFSYFFSRKTILTFAAEAYIFFPGGFGTMDELFGILTLIQTGKIPKVAIVLFDSSYWTGLIDFIKKVALEKYGALNAEDLNLFEITDSVDRAMEIVEKAPVMEWWRKIN